MNSSAHQIRHLSPQSVSQTRDFGRPFIGHKQPFVGRNQPGNRPFVGHFIPFAPKTAISGFTLIELAIALVILSIIASLAIPNFQRTLENNRLTTQANTFAGDLKFARSEAIKRGSLVRICVADAAGANCQPGGDWKARGWLVWADADNNRSVDAGETILRVREPLTGRTTTFGDPNDANNWEIAFDSQGRTNSGANNYTWFTLCYDQDNDGNPDRETGRKILISAIGTVRASRFDLASALDQCVP